MHCKQFQSFPRGACVYVYYVCPSYYIMSAVQQAVYWPGSRLLSRANKYKDISYKHASEEVGHDLNRGEAYTGKQCWPRISLQPTSTC